jgi:molybdate transport system substrate-binding protein
MNRLVKGGLALALTAFFALGLVACGDDAGADPTATVPAAPAATATPAVTGNITVFAAASLTDAFNELATEFKKANPGVGEITFNYAGSSALRTQLEQGARADIFASADTVQMDAAKKSGVIAAGDKIFARNSLVIITPKANPGKVTAPVNLKNPGLKLVLAAPEVPVGNYARQAFVKMEADAAYGAGFNDAVLKNVVSNEANVKQVVTKVQLGEADAGIVYGTDVTASVAPDLMRVEIPAAVNVIAEYPIALTKDAGNSKTGQAFIDFVFSAAGQTILKKYGFVGI